MEPEQKVVAYLMKALSAEVQHLPADQATRRAYAFGSIAPSRIA